MVHCVGGPWSAFVITGRISDSVDLVSVSTVTYESKTHATFKGEATNLRTVRNCNRHIETTIRCANGKGEGNEGKEEGPGTHSAMRKGTGVVENEG